MASDGYDLMWHAVNLLCRCPDPGRYAPIAFINRRNNSFCCADVLSEIHRSQESAYNLRDAARQDYLTRAKICSKILKYPHLEDYAVCTFRILGTPIQILIF